MRHLRLACWLAMLGVVAPRAAQALVLLPDADTYAQSNNSGPYGGSTILAVKYNDPGNNAYHRKAWLRYDLSSLTVRDFSSASLDLPFVESGIGSNATGNWTFSVYGLTDQTLDAWSEATLRWNDPAPGNDTTSGSAVDPTKTIFLGSFTVPGKGFTGSSTVWPITGSALETFLGNDTNDLATFIVCRDTQAPNGSINYVHAIASREHGSVGPAALNLPNATGTPPPPPPALFAYDGFSYAIGDLDGQNGGVGWVAAWSASGTTDQVVLPATPMQYPIPAGPIIDGGNRALQIGANANPVATRNLGQVWSPNDVFASMLLRWDAGVPGSDDFFVVRFGGTGGPQFGIKVNQGALSEDFIIRMGESGRPEDYAGQIAAATTYFLVVHLGKGADGTYPNDYDQFDIWINPAYGDSASPVETLIGTTATAVGSFSFIDFRSANFDGDDRLLIDELRIGTTWDEVLNNTLVIPEPASLAILGVGLLALARRRASRPPRRG